MQLNIAAVLMLLPAMSWACASYNYCSCINADGSTNSAATQTVCAEKSGDYSAGSCGAGDSLASALPLYLDDCAFSSSCKSAGAAGGASCSGKAY